MTPDEFNGILNFTNLSTEQITTLSLFYNKALEDGDIVARLEEEIKTNKERMEKFSTDGDKIVRNVVDKLLNKILHQEND